MLAKLVINMEKPEGYIDVSVASLFQGFVMDNIDSSYAEKLHSQSLNPYSQYVQVKQDKLQWIITTISKEAFDNIVLKLFSSELSNIEIKRNDWNLKIKEKIIEKSSYNELVHNYYLGNCERVIKVGFQTPTAFKSKGMYHFFPNIRHIFNSIINKYDAFSQESKIGSDDILEQIENHVYISGYNINTKLFRLEGVAITGFEGNIKIRINGPKQFVNLINMLIAFAQYSGIGIKASMGMGALQIL